MTSIQNRPNPVNHAMLMGLEMGVWFTINFIVSAQELRHPSLWLLSWLLTFYIAYGIYRAAQHYKQFECGGTISFSQAYSYILWLFLCSSVIAAILRFAYLMWLDTDFLSSMYDSTMKLLSEAVNQQPEMDKAIIDTFSETMPSLLTPIRVSMYYSMFDMFVGVFAGLILAPMVQRLKARFIFPFGNKDNENKDK